MPSGITGARKCLNCHAPMKREVTTYYPKRLIYVCPVCKKTHDYNEVN